MFAKLQNECRITMQLSPLSPIFIKTGESFELDPSTPDMAIIRGWHMGEMVPVIPGSSLKGVFRSRAEKYLDGSCNLFDNNDPNKCKGRAKNGTGTDKYKAICPACKLFGSLSLKSRVEFTDAYPIPNSFKTGFRQQVAINRLTGAAQNGALRDLEVLEAGVFPCTIFLRNYAPWQLKVILMIIQDLTEGYVRVGGSASRGFGHITAADVKVDVIDYTKPDVEIGFKKMSASAEDVMEKLKAVKLTAATYTEVAFHGI